MAVNATAEENSKNEMGIEEEEEKWVKHYSSNHQILLVGDGDFSFSLSLAQSLGSASNIVASSLDSYDEVTKKYKNAEANLQKLEELGGSHLHGVDATKMKFHSDLKMRKFDRIIFNFPHAGFSGKEDDVRLINKHKQLVSSFFANACGMLREYGEVHVNHKTTPPFCCWNLEELALKNSLVLIKSVDFKKEDYPGYSNKRGDSSRCDEPFPLGEETFWQHPQVPPQQVNTHEWPVFSYSSASLSDIPRNFMDRRFQLPHEAPSQIQQRPLWPSSRFQSLGLRRFDTSIIHTPLVRDGRSYEPQEASSRMQHLSGALRLDSNMSSVPFNLRDGRYYKSLDDPSPRMQHLSGALGLDASLSNIPLHLRDGRSYRTQEVPSPKLQHRFDTLAFDAHMSNISLHLRDGRSHQPQEASSIRMQNLSDSMAFDASTSNIPLHLRDGRSYKSQEVQNLSGLLLFNASMSNILHLRDGRSHQPQEAHSQMQHPYASLGLSTSTSNIPSYLRSGRSHPPVAPSQMQERFPSFGSIAGNNIRVSDWSLGLQLNDRGSWLYGRTDADLTNPIRDPGPNLRYERFTAGVSRTILDANTYFLHEPRRF